MTISFLTYVVTFSGQIYVHISYFFTPLQCNYFDTIFTSWSSYFFRAAAFFSWSCFFRTATSSQQFFSVWPLFQNKTSPEQPLLENRKFCTTVTFPSSYLCGGEIVWNRDIYGRVTYLKQLLQHRINIFRRATFRKS